MVFLLLLLAIAGGVVLPWLFTRDKTRVMVGGCAALICFLLTLINMKLMVLLIFVPILCGLFLPTPGEYKFDRKIRNDEKSEEKKKKELKSLIPEKLNAGTLFEIADAGHGFLRFRPEGVYFYNARSETLVDQFAEPITDPSKLQEVTSVFYHDMIDRGVLYNTEGQKVMDLEFVKGELEDEQGRFYLILVYGLEDKYLRSTNEQFRREAPYWYRYIAKDVNDYQNADIEIRDFNLFDNGDQKDIGEKDVKTPYLFPDENIVFTFSDSMVYQGTSNKDFVYTIEPYDSLWMIKSREVRARCYRVKSRYDTIDYTAVPALLSKDPGDYYIYSGNAEDGEPRYTVHQASYIGIYEGNATYRDPLYVIKEYGGKRALYRMKS